MTRPEDVKRISPQVLGALRREPIQTHTAHVLVFCMNVARLSNLDLTNHTSGA